MKDVNTDNYREAHKVVEEIQKVFSMGEDPEACNRITAFLQRKGAEEFVRRMGSVELSEQYYQIRQERNKQIDVEDLIATLYREQSKKRRMLWIRIASMAAIFIIGISIWQIWSRNDRNLDQVRIARNKIHYHEPTLILANGTALELQGLENQFIEQTGFIKKVADNKVAYDKNALETGAVVYNTLIVPSRYTYSVELADGTEVILNAGSELKYPVMFTDRAREVELKGEAYFRVAKSAKPFVVKMGKAAVRVYGTEFNVDNHLNGSIEVVLVRGSVGFNSSNESDREVRLVANQKCCYSVDNQEISVSDVNPEPYVAWLNNEFKYDKISLEYFLNKISAWYGVAFIYSKSQLASHYFYISADRNMNIADLLPLITKSTGLIFTRVSENEFLIK